MPMRLCSLALIALAVLVPVRLSHADMTVSQPGAGGLPINILTATTTTVTSGSGRLNHLIAVGGTMGNVTVYDNTAASGTVLFGPATPTAGGLIMADIDFSTGLTIVTAAASALSGSYRK